MNVVCRICLLAALMLIAFASPAESGSSDCLRQEVEAHVRQQFAIHGPRSAEHEYFGFIYLHNGVIGSAITRSKTCRGAKCVVDSAKALERVPRPAKILGEWHTHPHGGSPNLSQEDVHAAHGNRNISCYSAFYSTPVGEIYAWDPNRMSVPVAMASRAPIGNYNEVQAAAGTYASVAAPSANVAAGL